MLQNGLFRNLPLRAPVPCGVPRTRAHACHSPCSSRPPPLTMSRRGRSFPPPAGLLHPQTLGQKQLPRGCQEVGDGNRAWRGRGGGGGALRSPHHGALTRPVPCPPCFLTYASSSCTPLSGDPAKKSSCLPTSPTPWPLLTVCSILYPHGVNRSCPGFFV